jgi:hypothetical protein
MDLGIHTEKISLVKAGRARQHAEFETPRWVFLCRIYTARFKSKDCVSELGYRSPNDVL